MSDLIDVRYLAIDPPSSNEADIEKLAPSIGASGWIILQSYSSKPTFEQWSPGQTLPAMGTEFAGRIFGPDAEIRWIRDPSGFQLWRYREAAGGEKVRAVKRQYYCLGYWRDGAFWEPSLPSPIDYPRSSIPEDEDRPRFHGVEYYRTPPAVWPATPDEVETLLNKPLLVAYRLFHFDFGKD